MPVCHWRRLFRGILRRGALGLAAAPVLLAGNPEIGPALKVAYIYQFLNLTRWPDQGKTLVIGLFGESEVGNLMQSTFPGRIGARTVVYLRVRPGKVQPKPCHVLFIPEAYQNRVADLLARTEDDPTLVIGDGPNFVQNGGTIGLVVVGNRLRFDLNQSSATRKGLRFGADLFDHVREIQ